MNREACESLGYTRQELIGMTPLAFDRNVGLAVTESVAERTAAGETVFDTHWHQGKNGTRSRSKHTPASFGMQVVASSQGCAGHQ